jgi:hypothetical protein
MIRTTTWRTLLIPAFIFVYSSALAQPVNEKLVVRDQSAKVGATFACDSTGAARGDECIYRVWLSS